MPATFVRVIRHGVTNWNYDGRIQGQIDIPLAPEGEEQAAQAAAFLAKAEWDGLYTSDLQRAKRTAEALGKACALYPVVEPALRERNFGEFEGYISEEITARVGHDWDKAPGVETLSDLAVRGMRALERIAIAHPGERLLVVSHGALIRAVVEHILDTRSTRPIGNVSFTDLWYENGAWRVADVANEAHLIPPPGLEGLSLTGSKYVAKQGNRLAQWQAFWAAAGGGNISAEELRAIINRSLGIEIAQTVDGEQPVAFVAALADTAETTPGTPATAWVAWSLVHPEYAALPVRAELERRLRARYSDRVWMQPTAPQ